jgi:hypothetical protein
VNAAQNGAARAGDDDGPLMMDACAGGGSGAGIRFSKDGHR